jgi:hypothetical protein
MNTTLTIDKTGFTKLPGGYFVVTEKKFARLLTSDSYYCILLVSDNYHCSAGKFDEWQERNKNGY